MQISLQLSAAAEAIIFLIVFLNLSKIKLELSKSFIAISAIYIVSVFVFSHAIPIWNLAAIAGNISMIAIMASIANTKIRNLPLSVLYAVLSNIIFLLAGNIIGVPILYIRSITEDYVIHDFVLYVFYVLGVSVFAFAIAHLIGVFLERKISHFEEELKKKFSVYMLAAASVTLIYYFANSFIRELLDPSMTGMIHALSFIVNFVILAYATLIFTEKFQKDIEINHHREMLDNLQTYTNTIEKLTVEVRRFRHDHKNLMLGFYEHIENEDVVKIRKYYNDYMRTFTENTDSQNASIDNLVYIKIPEVKSLLLFKVLHAQRKGIDVKLELTETTENIGNHNIINLCRIMGILLDNALEACFDAEQPALKILLAKKGDSYIIVISNTCHAPPLLSKIFEKGFTTKPEGEGLGLYTVSLIVDEDENLFLSTHIENGWFTQKLIVS